MTADWPKNAACKSKPQEWFFPNRVGVNPTRALEVCAGCPVQAECLQFALTTRQEHGVWGGMTAEERRKQRTYRIAYCGDCGRRFTWLPATNLPAPRYCGDGCRKSARLKNQRESHQRRKRSAFGRTCGLIATYNAGCRCVDCSRAARAAKRRQRAKRIAESGVQ